MSETTLTGEPLSFVQKFRLTAASGIAIALFVSVGWTILHPADSYTAMTLILNANTGNLLPLLGATVALAMVSCAITTVVAGPPFPHAGVAATAVGLAAMATRGGTMARLLMYHEDRRRLAVAMAVETVFWALAIAAAWWTETVVKKWLGEPVTTMPAVSAPVKSSAGARIVDALVRWRDGLLGMVVCVAVAWIVINLTIARTPASAIERGQVYFAVGIAFMLGAMAGTQLWSRGAAGWYALSVVILAILGYFFGYASPKPTSLTYYSALATTPPNAMFRVLPIEYLSVGVIGALSGCWFSRRIHAGRAAARADG